MLRGGSHPKDDLVVLLRGVVLLVLSLPPGMWLLLVRPVPPAPGLVVVLTDGVCWCCPCRLPVQCDLQLPWA